MFKLQLPSKYSAFDAVHLTRWFFHRSERVLNLSILKSFGASAIFCFTSTASAKCFPLRTFLIWENKKKVMWGKIGWTGRVGHGGHAILGQKLLNTQHGVGRCSCKSPITKWANMLSLQKKFTEAKLRLSQQRQLVHWHRWVPRTLT